MTISVWRYSHLALAVSSFLFITLAAVTGIILAFEPVTARFPSYRAEHFNSITLAEAIPSVRSSFSEITDLTIDANQFVIVKGTDSTGKSVTAYVDPHSGKILGTPGSKSAFFQWVTSLHRSLFLHEPGRLFVGITAFLLLLIAVSGTILVIRRQQSVKRFFSKIVKENFAQYYHVVLGRLSLIPIIIISLTGTYLSMVRFNLFPEKKIQHHINANEIKSGPALKAAAFPQFKNILLSQVQSVEFPFSDDPEDYYTLKLKDREVIINQFTGEVLSEAPYPAAIILSNLSLNLHTGRTNIIWAIVLAIAAANILFFIYSGFVITFKRTAGKVKNRYKPDQCRFIILVGSENGSTMKFAKAVHQQLLAGHQTSFLTEMNNYQKFPKAEHILIFTSTYGLGDAPTNANRFASLLKKYPQQQTVHFSVTGFGSHAYPDFCRFAFEVNNLLTAQGWAKPLLEIHTINDKSPREFNQWLITWTQKLELPFIDLPETLTQKPSGLSDMTVVTKTAVTNEDGAFIIQLKPSWRSKFNSGDLLAIYPANDYRERLYSIGKIGKTIQLCIKLHENGLGSGYLHQLKIGDSIQARIVTNAHFHFPQKAPAVVMISNGTGIAPFLGMISENDAHTECHLYCGFRRKSAFAPFRVALALNQEQRQLTSLHTAYSRQDDNNKQYVKHLLERDADLIAGILAKKGVLMLCGSLSMQHDVIALLDEICQRRNGKDISYYQSHAQIMMDCY